jgi:hypothetical protein
MERSERDRAYYLKNREKKIAQVLSNYRANKEEILKKRKEKYHYHYFAMLPPLKISFD